MRNRVLYHGSEMNWKLALMEFLLD